MEREMEAPGFWDDPERSNQKMKELKNLKAVSYTHLDVYKRQSKDSESCASAHRCLHYAYARLIARVTFHLLYFLRNQFRPRHSKSGSVGDPLGGNM